MSEFALLSPVYGHSEATIGNSTNNNRNASSISENHVIMDDDRFIVLKESNAINGENLEAVDSLTLIGDPINDETSPSP